MNRLYSDTSPWAYLPMFFTQNSTRKCPQYYLLSDGNIVRCLRYRHCCILQVYSNEITGKSHPQLSMTLFTMGAAILDIIYCQPHKQNFDENTFYMLLGWKWAQPIMIDHRLVVPNRWPTIKVWTDSYHYFQYIRIFFFDFLYPGPELVWGHAPVSIRSYFLLPLN